MISYGLNTLKMPGDQILLVSTLAAFGWFGFTLIGGYLGDRLGRVRTFQIGYTILVIWAVTMWWLIDSKNIFLFSLAAFGLTAGLGLSYGPQAALYAELFPAKVRYSGISVGYALGAVLGGAFAPMIAQTIIGTYACPGCLAFRERLAAILRDARKSALLRMRWEFVSPIGLVDSFRHGPACPGHPRLSCCRGHRTWMLGTSPGMTGFRF